SRSSNAEIKGEEKMSENKKRAYFSMLFGTVSLVALAQALYDKWIPFIILFAICAAVGLFDGINRLMTEEKFRKLEMIEDVEEHSVFYTLCPEKLSLCRWFILGAALLNAAAFVMSFLVLKFHYLSFFLLYYTVYTFYCYYEIRKTIKEKKWQRFLEEYKVRGFE
ncbi:hypothetical protein, partial [Proteiniclasticum ruminis]|uniref:hypothetical protein n=2 Tax=Proteiniclasticum ruminis TaxID=398199 RepID=UPI00289BDE87